MTLRIDPILYKFVRYCVNKAYLFIDESSLTADERHSLDVVLTRLRQAEDNWKSVDDVVEFLKRDFLEIYKDALRRLPENLVNDLFKGILENCLDLEEVKSNERLLRAVNEALQALPRVKDELKKDMASRIYDSSA